MKAMIFAAGLGTRLRPLTDHTPKALIDVGGKPMLQHVIEKIAASGINDIVVNIHHHPDKVKSFLDQFHPSGTNIAVSDESDCLLDTGGGVVKALPLLGVTDDVLLHNADILSDFDLEEMMAFHKETKADITLLTAHRPTSRYLLFGPDGRMTGWENIGTGEIRSPYSEETTRHSERLGFGGVHILSPRALKIIRDYKPSDKKFSLTPFYIEKCDQLDIRSFTPAGPFQWFDIGKPETLEKARKSTFVC